MSSQLRESAIVDRDAMCGASRELSPESLLKQGSRAMKMGCVIWLTGISGSGKSTIARALHKVLSLRGHRVELLDGEERIGAGRASCDDADAHARRIGDFCGRLERHGIVAIASLVSPRRSSRAYARSLAARFVEVHVATPLAVCESRDPKGLYRQARLGHAPMTTVEYEPPLDPEVTIDTSVTPLTEAVSTILAKISDLEGLAPSTMGSLESPLDRYARGISTSLSTALAYRAIAEPTLSRKTLQ